MITLSIKLATYITNDKVVDLIPKLTTEEVIARGDGNADEELENLDQIDRSNKEIREKRRREYEDEKNEEKKFRKTITSCLEQQTMILNKLMEMEFRRFTETSSSVIPTTSPLPHLSRLF